MSNKASQDYQREHAMRALDTIAVKNLTNEDIVFWYDKHGTQPRKTLVPGSNKNIGFGNGIAHISRYLAEKFTEDHIVKLITEESDKAWDKRKKELRMLSKAEKLQIAETEPIRTNDTNKWNELFPQIWLGVVEKFGGEILPDPTDPTIPDSGNPMTDTMNKLGADKPYEPETAAN